MVDRGQEDLAMKAPGLRARKTDRTRRAIAEAALKAFQAKGYDTTPLEEVADAAQVHKRTLLRYFPTKAHLVLDAHYKALEEFRLGLAEGPGGSVLTLWENHVVRWSQKIAAKGPLANIGAIASKEPAVRQALLAIEAQYSSLIFEALWDEFDRKPDKAVLCQVAAAALVGGNYAVGDRLHAAKAYGEFTDQIRAVVSLVRERLLPASEFPRPKAASKTAS
jgi:AcrR family transcriptional regulator